MNEAHVTVSVGAARLPPPVDYDRVLVIFLAGSALCGLSRSMMQLLKIFPIAGTAVTQGAEPAVVESSTAPA